MARDRDDERSKRNRDDDDEKPKGSSTRVSLDDEDAIESGLFGSGVATIKESLFTKFKKFDDAVVWLLVLVRGEGKEKETYEQPFTIGKGWDVKKGELVALKDQKGLPKNCNAIKYLVTPLKKACEKAGISAPDLAGKGPEVLEGAVIDWDRTEQEENDFTRSRPRERERERGRDRGRDDAAPERDGPRTILTVGKVVEAPWDEGKGKSKGRAKDEDDDDLSEEATEALLAVLEEGKLKTGDELEEALEKELKGKKGSGAIIDIASSSKFLKKEEGWVFDGKYVELAKKARGRSRD